MESPLCPPNDPGFRLIETLRWTPERGAWNAERHLARLHRSARRLGICVDGAAAALDAVTALHPLRLRLSVDRSGQVELQRSRYQAGPPDRPWHIAIAPEPLDPRDPWLQLKTTRRALYDTARATLPDGVDEWIFLNTDGALCEGTITNLYLDLGQGLLTPPGTCGLLPGIGREILLAQGTARIAQLDLKDLNAARAIYIGNALRGLLHARLITL